jgi:hypothetical protein
MASDLISDDLAELRRETGESQCFAFLVHRTEQLVDHPVGGEFSRHGRRDSSK